MPGQAGFEGRYPEAAEIRRAAFGRPRVKPDPHVLHHPAVVDRVNRRASTGNDASPILTRS